MRLHSFVLATLLTLANCLPAISQTFRRLGTEFNAVRSVTVGAGKKCAIVVTQFFHHGELREDCRNLAVFTKSGARPVPARVLQNGPGDFCRVAFQTIEGQNAYEVLYGGEPPKEELPPWIANQGLLLETREFKSCNLNRYNAVRAAFEGSKRIGSDYVGGIHHSENPFTLRLGPFLTRYSGYLNIGTPGTYGFITSSQDCSFVVIDDKLVTEHPGMHGPRHQARPGFRQDVALAAGAHKLEYYHAAAGPNAVMTLAWEVNPRDPKPQPAAIPPEVFAAVVVDREMAGPPATRTEKLAPDFLVNVAGSVPLPDNERSLIGVQFLDASPRALASNSKFLWDFGDGQKSDQPNPDHVYLRAGLYAVKLALRRGGRTFEITNRIYVDEPKITDRGKFHQLDDYLRVMETYDARVMDAASLRQFVQAFQAKADALVAAEESDQAPEQPGALRRQRDQPDAGRKAQAMRLISVAVDAGKMAFVEDSAAKRDEDLIRLARLIGPMARDQLGNSQTAAAIWRGAAAKISDKQLRAECLVESADLAVNDMVNSQAAKPLLDEAAKLLGGGPSGPIANRFFRVWGDYYASTGDGKSARRAYKEAGAAMSTRKSYIERTAWQGARGRSTEQFLKTGEYDRAIAEIRQWQDEFPGDKVVGSITFIYARYWAGREKHPQAIALANQLAAVNADSPYIDQLQMLVAQSHLAMGAPEKAIATLESFLKAHPGSPLVPEAKRRLAEMKSGEATPKKTKKPARPAEK